MALSGGLLRKGSPLSRSAHRISGIKDASAEQEELLKKQFSSARRRTGAIGRESVRRQNVGLSRLAAQTGGGAGSLEKARKLAERDTVQQVADLESGLTGAEAAAQGQRKQMEQQALQQEAQFGETLQFQENSFADQMKFQWAEFNENLKTNWINSVVALKDAGLKSFDDWTNVAGLTSVLGGAPDFSKDPDKAFLPRPVTGNI